MEMYRTATPQEIADCIQRQVVEACDLAETDEYRSKPAKLRSLVRDIKIMAKSNTEWLRSQKASTPAPEMIDALRECITEDDAHCFTTIHCSRYAALRRRLNYINNTVRIAIAKATGE